MFLKHGLYCNTFVKSMILLLTIGLPFAHGAIVYQNSFDVDFYRIQRLAGEGPIATKKVYVICKCSRDENSGWVQLTIALDDYDTEKSISLNEPTVRSDIYLLHPEGVIPRAPEERTWLAVDHSWHSEEPESPGLELVGRLLKIGLEVLSEKFFMVSLIKDFSIWVADQESGRTEEVLDNLKNTYEITEIPIYKTTFKSETVREITIPLEIDTDCGIVYLGFLLNICLGYEYGMGSETYGRLENLLIKFEL